METEALTETLRETLGHFDVGEPRTTPEVADDLGLGRRATYNRLERLVDTGRLRTKKVGANARVWWRSPATASGIPNWTTAAESLVDDVLDDVEVGIFVLDDSFDVVWINEATERYFGLDRDEVLHRNTRRLIGDHIASIVEDPDAFEESVLATYDDNTYTEHFECHVTLGDGRDERWLEHWSEPIQSGEYAGGRVELYYDVTDRKQAQIARQEERNRFESLVSAVEEYAIFTLDSEGRVQTWNPGIERIKGYEQDYLLGEHFSIFYTEEERAAGIPEQNLEAAAEHGSIEDEGWRVRQDGSRFWANVTLTAIRDDDGNLQGYAKVTRDMSERRRAEAERELLYETTRSIAEAETFDEGLQAALRDVCAATDWDYAEAWLPTGDGSLRRADADYYVDDLAEFAAYSEVVAFEHGEGIPGRVYASETFEWITDLTDGSTAKFPRLDEALDAGLNSAVGVPVIADGEVVAVLTFAVRETRNIDEPLIDLISSVAAELGDLIARRRVQERLERERTLVEHIFETTPVGISVFESDGELVRANERMGAILDSVGEDIADYTVGDVPIHDEDGEPLSIEDRPVDRVFETGEQVVNQELQVRRSDGAVRWLSVNATPSTDADGEIVQVIATATDITQLKKQAERLERRREELESELEDVFVRIDDAFYALDGELRFEYVNDRAEDLLGYSERELLGRDIWEVLAVTDDDPIRERFQTAITTQEPVTFERHSDSLGIWETVRIYPSRSGLSVYFRDITERKERERELEEYRQWTRTLIENYPSGAVALVDEDLRYITFGGSPEGDTDVTREDLEGQYVPEALPNQIAEVVVPRYEAALDGETSEFVESIDGRVYQFHFVPVRDEDGEVFATTAMSQDITEQQERERELEESEQRYRTLLENFPNGIVALFDEDLRYLVAGGKLYDEFGRSPHETVGKTLHERSSPEEVELLEPHYRAALDGEMHSFETKFYDRVLQFWTVPVTDDEGNVFAGMAMSQDVTEQREREGQIQEAKAQLEAATEAGAVGTWEWRIPDDEFVAGASLARTFGVDPESARDGVSLDRFLSSIHKGDRKRVKQAVEDAVASCGEYRQEYRVWDTNDELRWVVARGHVECDEEGNPVTFLGALVDITERKQAEQELERQREQLSAMNSLNEVVRDITAAVIDQSTRDNIEETVCERLAASDSYLFAWIGEVDPTSQRVALRTEAGVEGYLDDITISVDPDDPRSEGPTGRALRTGEIHATHDIQSDSRHDPWRAQIEQYGVCSSAAIPIAHEGTVYGVLNVYAGRSNAFEGQERDVIGQLGEVVGHAIASTERKQALLSDELVELDFQIQDIFSTVGATVETSGTISMDHIVPTDDGEFLIYGSATRDAVDTVQALVDVLPYWESVSFWSDDEPTTFELKVIDPPVMSAVASRGGYIDESIIEDGDLRMTIHLAPSVDVRLITDVVEAAYPPVELLRRRQIENPHDGARHLQQRLAVDLTDRQRSALEAAYHAGYFKWPRESTGERVAESLGIASPTFHQHLRKAQQKAFDAMLSPAIQSSAT